MKKLQEKGLPQQKRTNLSSAFIITSCVRAKLFAVVLRAVGGEGEVGAN